MAREYSVQVTIKKGREPHSIRLFARAEDVADAVGRVLRDDLKVYDDSLRVGSSLEVVVYVGDEEVDADEELSV